MTERAVTIAVLGTGTMGAPIARNLLSAGFSMRVWNRTIAKAAAIGVDAHRTIVQEWRPGRGRRQVYGIIVPRQDRARAVRHRPVQRCQTIEIHGIKRSEGCFLLCIERAGHQRESGRSGALSRER